jgi:hypothetical protein
MIRSTGTISNRSCFSQNLEFIKNPTGLFCRKTVITFPKLSHSLRYSNGRIDLLYFIAILQWSIGHQPSDSIGGGFWLEFVVRQMIFSHIPSKQCASRWLWGVHVIFFLAGSILIRCGKFRFDFFVECVLFNHICFALSLHLFLTVQFFHTALWHRFDIDFVMSVWWSEDLWASQTCFSISSDRLDMIWLNSDKWEITPSNPAGRVASLRRTD